jgi:hypothetical protein
MAYMMVEIQDRRAGARAATLRGERLGDHALAASDRSVDDQLALRRHTS